MSGNKGGEQSPPTSSDDLSAIAAIFRARAEIYPAPQDIVPMPYLLSLIRAHPRDFMDSPERAEAVRAMRTLVRLMPGLIEQAEAIAETERRAARSTWTDRYATQGRTLLAALEPFTLTRRDYRGWWHGWAKTMTLDIRVIFTRAGKVPSFSHPDAAAVLIVADLMALAGHHALPDTIVDALRE